MSTLLLVSICPSHSEGFPLTRCTYAIDFPSGETATRKGTPPFVVKRCIVTFVHGRGADARSKLLFSHKLPIVSVTTRPPITHNITGWAVKRRTAFVICTAEGSSDIDSVSSC